MQLCTEEDLKNKIVNVWLAEHGLHVADLQFEHTFKVKIGRQVHVLGRDTFKDSIVRPRCDILVKNSYGMNLAIIEVKAPTEMITNDDRDQAVSYARLLEGNIAPVAIVTNGEQTIIYDTITLEHITEHVTKLNVGDLSCRFQLDCNDIALKASALDLFISLSPQNLLTICSSILQFRIHLLKASDPFSDKKYVPSLHVERTEYEAEIKHLLKEDGVSSIIVAGPPLIGKTNVMCHLAESLIEDTVPCLFYSANRLCGGLIDEIAEDFGWTLNDYSASFSIVNKLLNISKYSSSVLTIFIDGLNEVGSDSIKRIDSDCHRLMQAGVKVVVSVSTVAISRTLIDTYGNLAYIAERAHLKKADIFKLQKDFKCSLPENNHIVSIGSYCKAEVNRAEELYKKVWNIDVPHQLKLFFDPYNFSTGMKLFRNSRLPEKIDEIVLIRGLIEEKISHICGTKYNLRHMLKILADLILKNDGSVDQETVVKAWSLPETELLPESIFINGMLMQVYDGSLKPKIDFYLDREKYYFIAYHVTCWSDDADNVKLSPLKYGNSVEVEAFKWFLGQTSVIKSIIAKDPIPPLNDSKGASIFIEMLRHGRKLFPEYRTKLILYVLGQLKADVSSEVFVSLLQLLYESVNYIGEIFDLFGDGNITKGIKFPKNLTGLHDSDTYQLFDLVSLIFDANRLRDPTNFNFTYEGCDNFLIMNAAICLACDNEYEFLKLLVDKIGRMNRREWHCKLPPFCLAVEYVAQRVHSWHEDLCLYSDLDDLYTPGIDDIELANEYNSLRSLYGPVITAFHDSCSVGLFTEILTCYEEALLERGVILEEVIPVADPFTLPLPFDV